MLYRDRPDVASYVKQAQESGGPGLELGCGTGRVLIPPARAGIEIVGVDLSRSMLAICRDKLAREPDDVRARVEMVEADMRRFDLGREFRLVTLPFRPFQHLMTVQDQLSCSAEGPPVIGRRDEAKRRDGLACSAWPIPSNYS